MTLKELEEKLIRKEKLQELISTKVKRIYEEHEKLVYECADEIFRRKGGDLSGLPKASVTIKFRSGRRWKLNMNYAKNGQFCTIWKPVGVHAFEIKEM